MERLYYVSFWPVLAFFAAFIASIIWYLRRRGNAWIGLLTVFLMFSSVTLVSARYQNVRDTVDTDIMVDNLSCGLAGSPMFDYKGLEYWTRVGHAFVFMRFNEYGVPQREKGVHILVCPDGTQVKSTQY